MLKCSRGSFIGSGAAAMAMAGLAGSLSGCSPRSASDLQGVRFVFIVKTPNSDYWQACIAGGKAAARQFGLDALQFTGANSEANIQGQIEIVEDAVAKNPAFIVLAPTAASALVPAVQKAYDARIKVILIDSAANTQSYQTFLATDNHKAGMLAAKTLAEAIVRKTGSASGKIAYSTFLSGVGSLALRDRGFLDGLKAYPELQVVAHKDAGGDQSTKPIGIVSDTLTSFPDLVGYFADTLITLEGAVTAFKENHVDSKRMSLVGFDPSPRLIRDLESGIVDGIILQDPYQMGYGGVAYGVLAAAGVMTPKNIDTGVYVATTENVQSSEIRGLLNPITQRHLGFGVVR